MISLLCPSRGRANEFARMHYSALDTADQKFEILLYLDFDDECLHRYLDPHNGFTVIGKRKYLGPAYQALFQSCHGQIVMMCADDLIFRTKGWDTKVKEAMPSDGIGVVSFDDQGIVKAKYKREHGHPFIGRNLIDLMGYICPSQLSHSMIDNWVVEIAQAVGRFYYLPDILIEHVHPKYGKGELDQTYLDNTELIKARDGQFFKHEGRAERNAVIERVNQYICSNGSLVSTKTNL